MKDNHRDELDDLIDGALSGYSSASPLEGLEERVLQRIRVAGAARSSRWPTRWWFAVPVLAALFVAAVVLWPSRRPLPLVTKLDPRPRTGGNAGETARATGGAGIQPAGKKPAGQAFSLPKEECFPAPAPMTEEERVLVAWAGRAPAEAAQAFADLRKRSEEPVAIQPVVIEAILIKPLQSDGTN